MYYCFQTTDRLDVANVVDFHTARVSDEPLDGYYCVEPENHPEVFQEEYDDDGTFAGYRPLWMFGWENLPAFTYTPESGFEPYDPYSDVSLKRWWRREFIIQPQIRERAKLGTELKHIRKALDAIVRRFPELQEEPEIKAMTALSEHIQGCISTFPKERADEEIDMRIPNEGARDAKEMTARIRS